MKRPELPFKKLPVLTHGDLTIASSTSILRYVAQLPGRKRRFAKIQSQRRPLSY